MTSPETEFECYGLHTRITRPLMASKVMALHSNLPISLVVVFSVVYVAQGHNYYLNYTIHSEGTTLDNNLYFGGGDGPVRDVNAINADPMFVNAGVGDFHPQSGSQAVNGGSTGLIYPVLDDFEFNVRNASNGIDVGAYELQE